MRRTASAEVGTAARRHSGPPAGGADDRAPLDLFSTSASLPQPPLLAVWSRGSGDGGRAAAPDAAPGSSGARRAPAALGGDPGRGPYPRDRGGRAAFARGLGAGEGAHPVASIPEEAPLPGPPDGDAAPRTAGLARVLRALARSRAGGQLLHALEWAAYEQALCLGSTAARMAAAATAAGDAAEARFWRGLPATLAALRAALPAPAPSRGSDLAAGVAAAFGPARSRSASGQALGGAGDGASPSASLTSMSSRRGSGGQAFAARAFIGGDPRAALPVAPTARAGAPRAGGGGLDDALTGTGPLWADGVELAEARERMAWHEAMGRGGNAPAEHLQARAPAAGVAAGQARCAARGLRRRSLRRRARRAGALRGARRGRRAADSANGIHNPADSLDRGWSGGGGRPAAPRLTQSSASACARMMSCDRAGHAPRRSCA